MLSSELQLKLGLIPILYEHALNHEKRTAKNAKNAKEDRGNYLVQAYRELVLHKKPL
ncbi:MAG: hypothetical protein V7L20_23730 [Nostoc sp.]|uniref:hypothetical protein n=1 Tax=Nostoc sp. TaxID=1180 RepID=UPI002FFBEE34